MIQYLKYINGVTFMNLELKDPDPTTADLGQGSRSGGIRAQICFAM